ncbi:MAG: response regulator [Spirochaetia bacterium]|nr:response regulator [Spirochaetia bacterium]
MKKSILFVDDEQAVIDGLKRSLRSMRASWNMYFTTKPREAIDLVAQNHVDLIVTDIRMPEMDGSELLIKIRTISPETIRIVLSGQMGKETGLRISKIANLCLWKPCDPEELKIAIMNAYSIRERLRDKYLQKLVSGLITLPSLPVLYEELVQEFTSKEASVKRAGEIISKDISMTSKILQLVNSAFFGISRTITDPKEAVILLGKEIIMSLVLSTGIFSSYKNEKIPEFSIERLWNHSFNVALYAKEIAKIENQKSEIVEGCFLAGLLHDLGKLILALNFPEKYGLSIESARKENISSHEMESKIFSASHAEVGAVLAGMWSFQDPIVEAITYHHVPSLFSGKNFRPLSAVHAANYFDHIFDKNDTETLQLDEKYIVRCGFSEKINLWKEKCWSIYNNNIKENKNG